MSNRKEDSETARKPGAAKDLDVGDLKGGKDIEPEAADMVKGGGSLSCSFCCTGDASKRQF
jgi:hypothetical protein